MAPTLFALYASLKTGQGRRGHADQQPDLCHGAGSRKDIYTTFTGMDDNTTLQQVLANFNEHFVPRVNVLHERALFYSRAQQPDENV